MCKMMKVLFVAVLCLGLSGAVMAAGPWLAPTYIGSGTGSIAVGAAGGTFGAAYYSAGTAVKYSALAYAGLTDTPVASVSGEQVYADASTYGSQVMGLGFSGGAPVFATVQDGTPNVNVYTKSGTWSGTTAATGNAGFVTANSFVVDSVGKQHLVYAKAGSVGYATNASGSWVTADLSVAPFYGDAPYTRPSLALDSSGNPQAGITIEGYVWKTQLTGAPTSAGGNQTWGAGAQAPVDIAMNAGGTNPMVAYLQESTGAVKVAMFNGSTWDTSTVHTYGGPYDVGQRNTLGAIQIKVDSLGRPVVLVNSCNAHEVYPDPQDTVSLDYYVLDGGVWTGTNVATLASVTDIKGMDLTFDAAGRPFIGFTYQPTGGDLGAYYTTVVPEPMTMLLLGSGLIGMVVRRKK